MASEEDPGPEALNAGVVPGGVMLHFHDATRGGLVCERAVEAVEGLDEFGPPDVAELLDEQLRPLRIVAYHGDTGARLPGLYGVVCQLRARTRARPPRPESGFVGEGTAAVDDPELGP